MNGTVSSLRQRDWDWRAAGNFIAGGTGSGLIVVTAAAAMGDTAFRLPFMLGLVCVAAGLSLVWLEIGRPWRALHIFFHPQTSWMTREGIVAGILLMAGLFAAVTNSLAAVLAAAVLAVGFLYCQARILRAARGIPAWRQAEIVFFILATGLAEGSGMFLITGGRNRHWVILALLASLLRETAYAAYRSGLAATPAAAPALAVLGRARSLNWLRFGGLMLLAAALAAGAPSPASTGLAIAGGVLIVLSGWAMKGLIITRAAFKRAATIPVMPARGS